MTSADDHGKPSTTHGALPGDSQRTCNYEEKLESYGSSLPLFEDLRSHLDVHSRRIGWHCHLTALTVVAARCLREAGAEVFMSECDSTTSDQSSIAVLRDLGIQVFLGAAAAEHVLQSNPEVLCDTGGELLARYLEKPEAYPAVKGASEITTSGIARLPANLPLPVINLNNGQLKNSIENFHGVGDGVVELLRLITPRSWAARKVLVIGYGQVGSGVAWHLKKLGCYVSVIDRNPVRQLIAHFDGFKTGSLFEALAGAELVVTATGSPEVLTEQEINWLDDECVLMNVGHFAHEIDRDYLENASKSKRQVNEYLTEYELGLKKVLLVCDGHPANVVALTGFPEPTLIHLTNELLTMNYLLTTAELAPGLHVPPGDIEKVCASLALKSLKLAGW